MEGDINPCVPIEYTQITGVPYPISTLPELDDLKEIYKTIEPYLKHGYDLEEVEAASNVIIEAI